MIIQAGRAAIPPAVSGVEAYFDFVIPSAFFLARGICFSSGGPLRAAVKIARYRLSRGAVTPDSLFAGKTKRPRPGLGLGTSVDQPSPKCCSRTTIRHSEKVVYGPCVPYMARACYYQNLNSNRCIYNWLTPSIHVITGILLTPAVPNTRR